MEAVSAVSQAEIPPVGVAKVMSGSRPADDFYHRSRLIKPLARVGQQDLPFWQECFQVLRSVVMFHDNVSSS